MESRCSGTKSLILLIAPIPEAIFLDNLSGCAFATLDFHHKYSKQFYRGNLFYRNIIESSGGLKKVLNLCLDPISINSVFAVFKVSLLETSYLFRLPKS